ncbi:MAG: hypothetical protein J3R72DRAFT_458577 [Linnemannia gamsii]|nr:MAG: hypothetical protein J3R72DRAFT_458577 [Linnemannia gamsii]
MLTMMLSLALPCFYFSLPLLLPALDFPYPYYFQLVLSTRTFLMLISFPILCPLSFRHRAFSLHPLDLLGGPPLFFFFSMTE